MQLRTLLTTGFCCLALAIAASPASAAGPAPAATLFDAAAPKLPLFDVAAIDAGSSVASPSSSPALAAAAAQATTATAAPNNHQFGLGVRVGGVSFGMGGSVRYFFYGGPLGVQAEVARYGMSLGTRDWSSFQFSPAAIYRFPERKFEAPLTLTPYAGAGLNFINQNFGDNEDFFTNVLGVDDTDLGVLLFGGVELFFERIPNLGVSGELTYKSNDDIGNTGVGSTSLGGVAFTGAAHWYFW